jgi:hypothetical protein
MVADVLVINFFCYFGVPREPHNNHGWNFQVLKCLRIKQDTDHPPSPAVR